MIQGERSWRGTDRKTDRNVDRCIEWRVVLERDRVSENGKERKEVVEEGDG